MANEIILIVFYVAILLYSVILHEISHGVAALWLGDPTAKYAGRLTLNPVKHIDPLNSIILPIGMLLITNFQFAFGSARPVPYNPYNLRNQKWGPAMVALAGPGVNIIIAIIFSIAARLISIPSVSKVDIIYNFNDWQSVSSVISGSVGAIFFELFVIIIFWNVILAFFNLIPFPPLDGSKLLFAIVPIKNETIALMEQFGFIALLVFILIFAGPLGKFLNYVLGIFLGLTV